MAILKRGDEVTKEVNGKVKKIRLYEKKVVTKIFIDKEFLLRKKAELTEELKNIELEIAEIEQDEKENN